ncbi:hypothetical protein ACFLYH_00670, partial [Candidatus Dependentiae bacterium]
FYCHGIRNPFYITKDSTKNNKKNILSTIRLVGVVKMENNFAAILQKKLDKKVVSLNESVWGYKVCSISLNKVLLERGNKKIKLLIS